MPNPPESTSPEPGSAPGQFKTLQSPESGEKPTARPAATGSIGAVPGMDEALGQLPVFLWEMMWDPENPEPRITYASPSVERIVGYPAEHWRQYPDFLEQVIHPEDFDRASATLAQALIDEDFPDIQFRCITRDGRVVWLEGHPIPVRDASGRLVGIRGVAVDITDRKRAEERTLESEARYRRVAESSTEGIWIVDANGCTTWINQRVTELLGYTLEDLSSRCVFDLVESDDGVLRSIVAPGTEWDPRRLHEVQLRHKDGSRVWVSVAISLTRGEDGSFLEALCLVTDITEQKRTQEALRRSESQYRLLAENARDVIIRFDRSLRYLYVNRAVESVMGLTPDRLIGRSMWDVGIPLDRVAFWAEQVESVIDTDQERLVEFEYEAITGRRFFQMRLIPEQIDGGGEPTCLLLGRDITQRRKMEERQRFLAEAGVLLTESLDFDVTVQSVMRLIVPRLADCCIVDLLNDNGTLRRAAVVHADPTKEGVLHDLRRRHPFRVSDGYGIPLVVKTGKPELNEEIQDCWLDAVAEDEVQLRLLRTIGMKSTLIVPLTARGRTIGAMMLISAESGHTYTQDDLALAEDLARRCALAMDNALLYQEVQQMNVAKDEFLAVLGHELRNPLAAISNALRAVRSEEHPGAAFSAVGPELEHEVQSMSRLVEDLLDVARISRGRIQLRHEALDMSAAVRAAAETMRPLLTERNHVLDLQLASDPMTIVADPMRFEQVLCNLLHNAAKYTPAGGRILLETRECDNMAVLRCADNGIGIARDAISMLFRPFYQVDPQRELADNGLGLGLSLVKSLVELHGGTVQARSDGPGHGSEFIVRWPLAQRGSRLVMAGIPMPAPGAGGAEQAAAGRAPAGRGVPAPAVAAGPRRILLVEDNAFSARMLRRILEDAGHQVEHADNGPEALRIAGEFSPDVVLLDIGLPGMDGYEVARRLRATPGTAHILMIALTGYGRDEDRERARAAGFDRHLVKPVDFDALVDLLSESRAAAEGPALP